MSAKWTEARSEKFRATMKAKAIAEGRVYRGSEPKGRSTKSTSTSNARSPSLKHVAVWLRHAQRDIMERIRSGDLTAPDHAHMMALMALKELEQ